MATNQREFPYSLDGDALYQSYRDQYAAGDRPTYAGTYDQPLSELYGKISSRPAFSYDVKDDPLYQGYKDRYIQQGKLAMKDTMGQAAALTGGYDSTYGQQVGQQTYDAYLQNLSAVVPELYDRAYGRYKDTGDDLLQQYNLMGQQRDIEYGQYRDELGDWQNERAYQTQLENEEYNRRTAAEEREYQRSQDALAQQQRLYSALYSIIASTGYSPTDDELAAAGMTREAAEALAAEYRRGVDMENQQLALQMMARSGGGGGGGGRSGGGGGSGKSSGGGYASAYDYGLAYGDYYGYGDSGNTYTGQPLYGSAMYNWANDSDRSNMTQREQMQVYQGIVDSLGLAFLDK